LSAHLSKLLLTTTITNQPPKEKEKENENEKKRSSSEAELDRVQTGRVEKKLRYPVRGGLSSSHGFDRPTVAVKFPTHPMLPPRVLHVHQNVLGASSFFLQDALRSRPEGSTDPIVIPRSTFPEPFFKIYIDWLYSGRIHVTASTGFALSAEWGSLKLCYKLGKSLRDCSFRDAVIDAMIEFMIETGYGTSDFDEFIYRHANEGSPGSPHRKLALDLAVNVWPDAFLEEEESLSCLSKEFLMDLVAELATKGRVSRVEWGSVSDFLKDIDTCIYHEHTITEIPNSIIPCYKTKYEGET
jgi:hypothetical protein